jgi:hypothetical protein
LGAAETKLLYTLHWVLLDSAEECADMDFERGIRPTSPFHYVFPISAITVIDYISDYSILKTARLRGGKVRRILSFYFLNLAVRLLICTIVSSIESDRFQQLPS